VSDFYDDDAPPGTAYEMPGWIHGYVREAGGGVIVIVVARDTESYPWEGAQVMLKVTG